MFVINRNNEKVSLKFDSITDRNISLAKDLNIDVTLLSQTVIKSLKSGMTTKEIDKLSCETAIGLSVYNTDYDIIASRIFISDLHKSTDNSIYDIITKLNLRKEIVDFVYKHKDALDKVIDYNKDYNFKYFGLKMLEKMYLMKL